MYSEALAVLDHNTELYMIEEKQQEIDAMQVEINSLQSENDSLQSKNDSLQSKNDSLQSENDSLQIKLKSADREKLSLAEKLAEYESKYGKL